MITKQTKKQLDDIKSNGPCREKVFYITKGDRYAEVCEEYMDCDSVTFMGIERFEVNVDAGMYRGLRVNIYYDHLLTEGGFR